MIDREKMVETQIEARGVVNPRVLDAMRSVPRELFVPEDLQNRAFDDCALPIGHGQTISQPYIVAFMTELLNLEPDHRVLEIVTGSGYQTAVLHHITPKVFTMEIVPAVHAMAKARLTALGMDASALRLGNGHDGWPEQAPFDAILVTAAAGQIPRPLIDQLKPGGRMVVPVGPKDEVQSLTLVTKDARGQVAFDDVLPVRFVPMTGDDTSRHRD